MYPSVYTLPVNETEDDEGRADRDRTMYWLVEGVDSRTLRRRQRHCTYVDEKSLA